MHSDNEMVNLRSVIETLCYMVDDDSDGVEEVMQLPSIDIVRCKECLHSYEWDSGCGAELVCKARRCDPADWGSRIEFYVKADDFCSYGEREGERCLN